MNRSNEAENGDVQPQASAAADDCPVGAGVDDHPATVGADDCSADSRGMDGCSATVGARGDATVCAGDVFCLSPRLELRGWGEGDFSSLAALCADPQVMRYFPSVLTVTQSRSLFELITAHFARCGYGPFSVWLREARQWLGFVGLAEVGADLPFAPAVEIVWRLRPECWGNGYATEAAQAALRYGFEHLGLRQVVAFTTETNEPSQRVMLRLGMLRNCAEDFDHPRLPVGHPLLRHRLYRLARASGK